MLLTDEVASHHPVLSDNPYQPHMARIVRIYKMVENNYLFTLRFLEDHMNIHPDDGLAEIFIIKARTILDLPQLIWQVFVKPEQRTPKYRKISAVKRILITTIPPVFVQADGEFLGMTPVNVKVSPKIIRVIAP